MSKRVSWRWRKGGWKGGGQSNNERMERVKIKGVKNQNLMGKWKVLKAMKGRNRVTKKILN